MVDVSRPPNAQHAADMQTKTAPRRQLERDTQGCRVQTATMNTKSLMQETLAAVDRQLIAVDRPAFLNSGITGTVCICRQTSCICRQIHIVQKDDALSAAICRQEYNYLGHTPREHKLTQHD
ncbi:hypothetical protein Taro_008588 [Colocasia esculenta]|uniref:Uncharacterized protein n=1 Tax=Colocasia esculenta TaxID=4460 RepID=A0A843U2P2_COLES|nr:hypothetical protein [Colocasia esculenta]